MDGSGRLHGRLPGKILGLPLFQSVFVDIVGITKNF